MNRVEKYAQYSQGDEIVAILELEAEMESVSVFYYHQPKD